MSDTITIEGTLLWPKFTEVDPYKEGYHTFEVTQLSDEDVDAIEALNVESRQEPREKNLANIKKALKKAKASGTQEEVDKLELRLKTAEEAGTFITLKQKATRKENRKQSQYYGRTVNWPVAVKKADGSYYTKEETETLANGCKIRCDIKKFKNSYGWFYSYVPSSLFILEEVIREIPEGEFVESELAEEESTPVMEEPVELDPLDDEIPL